MLVSAVRSPRKPRGHGGERRQEILDAALALYAERGVQGALAKLDDLVEQAVASVPDCEGAQEMRDLVRMTAMRLAPKQLSRSAA
jgi:DNA-binding transcriptional regulator YbjK